MQSVRAYKMGDMTQAAAVHTPTSAPAFGFREAMVRSIRLPDGRVVSVREATEQEFHAYVVAIASLWSSIVGNGTCLGSHKENIATSMRDLLIYPVQDDLDKWHVLLELARCVTWLRCRHDSSIELFENNSTRRRA